MARGRPPRDRRKEILDIAGTLFLENGFQGTSMSRIAAALGGSKGTLYAYFNSKEELFEAYLHDLVQTEAASLVLPDHSEDMVSVLTAYGRRYLELFVSEASVALMRILYHEVARFPEIGRSFYEACIQSGRTPLANYLGRANGAGVLDVPDPEMAADQFYSLCEAPIVMPIMLGMREEADAEAINKAVDAAVAVFFRAYRK